MLSDYRLRKRMARTRAGNGRPLEPFRWWHLVAGRKLFSLSLVRADGSQASYDIDVRLSGKQAGGFGMVHLYLDGRHVAESTLPTAIRVEGGVIVVELSTVGLQKAQYLPDEGKARLLTPHPKTAIGRRMQFDRDHPVFSRWVAAIAVFMLLIGVGLNGLQVLEPLSQIPPIAEHFGRFESPLRLPLWLNLALGLGAGFAATERALRLKFNWLLDGVGT